jgi:phospholipid/cholesterol/gamma-HCH transport system substrate-binding protein
MNIPKEVRIGILVTAALVIFFTGFYFLKGADLFSNNFEYICYFENVDGLQKSSTVQVNGLVLGHVSRMELAGSRGVKLTLAVNKKIQLPIGTTAIFAAPDVLGPKLIRLQLGKGPGIIEPGTELPSTTEGGLVDKLSDQLTPSVSELKKTISTFNTTLENVNEIVDVENRKAISSAIQSLESTAHNLEQISHVLNKESTEVSSILHNTNSITANLVKSNDTVQRILSNVSNVSRQLANAPIQKTLSDLQHTTGQLQSIISKINNNEGSLGMLINNKEVYNNLNSSLKSLNSLTDDMKAHPSRYINVSVFGSKKKG